LTTTHANAGGHQRTNESSDWPILSGFTNVGERRRTQEFGLWL
jgi:hypothetical protein